LESVEIPRWKIGHRLSEVNLQRTIDFTNFTKN
jgi:hypothetical protein